MNFNKDYELIEPKDLQKNILKAEPEKNNLEKNNEYLKKLKEMEFDLILWGNLDKIKIKNKTDFIGFIYDKFNECESKQELLLNLGIPE